MRRINLVEYEATPVGGDKPLKVNVFSTLEEILSAGKFSPKLLLDRMDLIARLRKSVVDDGLFVEEADYKVLVDTMETIEGFSSIHEEFVRRVLGAPTASVGDNVL